MRRYRLPAAAALLLWATLGSDSFAFTPSGSPPVVLAGTISRTGKFVETGRQLERGYRLFAERANATGGILGRPVRILLEDDRSDPLRARSLYEGFLRERKGDLLLAPYSSEITLAVADLFERHRTPVVAAGASSSAIWSTPRRYLFGLNTPSDRHMEGFLEMCARQGLRTVSVVGFADLYSTSAAEGARRTAERMGMTVARFRILPSREEKGIAAEAVAVAAASPDAVMVCGYIGDAVALRLATKAASVKARAFAATVGPAQPRFRKLLGPLAEGVFGPSEWEPLEAAPGSDSMEFLEAYRARYGEEPPYQAALGYAAGQIIRAAAEESGSLDPARVAETIRRGGYATIVGLHRLRPDGARSAGTEIVIQWQQHRKEIVWPPSLRTAAPVL